MGRSPVRVLLLHAVFMHVVAHVSVSGVFAPMVLRGQRVLQLLSANRRWLQSAAEGVSCA